MHTSPSNPMSECLHSTQVREKIHSRRSSLHYHHHRCGNSTTSVPNLVSFISNLDRKEDGDDGDNGASSSSSAYDVEGSDFCELKDLKLSHDLAETMRYSLHPPHVLEEEEEEDVDGFSDDYMDKDDGKGNVGGDSSSPDFSAVPGAAFPVCSYDGDLGGADSASVSEYPGDRFCRAFQTTFNDHGLCYTFNNVHLGTLDGKEEEEGGGGVEDGAARSKEKKKDFSIR